MPGAPLHFLARPQTFDNAQRLRREMTQAEKILWKLLRRNKINGFYFRRQHPIGKFIADFYCHKAKLVIEVDGITHSTPEEIEYDNNRTAFFEKLGLTVIRFNNADVFRTPDLVIAEIEKRLSTLSSVFPLSNP